MLTAEHNNEKSEKLVETHAEWMLSYALKRVRALETAEDLVHDTLLVAIENCDDYREEGALAAWMTGILKNKIALHFRNQARQSKVLDEEGTLLEDSYLSGKFKLNGGWRESPGDWRMNHCELERQEFWQQLNKCIEGLPDRLAEVFVARELNNQSAIEISNQLEIKTNHMWVMLHRARLRMRDCLEKYWFTDKPDKPEQISEKDGPELAERRLK